MTWDKTRSTRKQLTFEDLTYSQHTLKQHSFYVGVAKEYKVERPLMMEFIVFKQVARADIKHVIEKLLLLYRQSMV